MAFCASFSVRSRSQETQRAFARCGRVPRRSPGALGSQVSLRARPAAGRALWSDVVWRRDTAAAGCARARAMGSGLGLHSWFFLHGGQLGARILESPWERRLHLRRAAPRGGLARGGWRSAVALGVGVPRNELASSSPCGDERAAGPTPFFLPLERVLSSMVHAFLSPRSVVGVGRARCDSAQRRCKRRPRGDPPKSQWLPKRTARQSKNRECKSNPPPMARVRAQLAAAVSRRQTTSLHNNSPPGARATTLASPTRSATGEGRVHNARALAASLGSATAPRNSRKMPYTPGA